MLTKEIINFPHTLQFEMSSRSTDSNFSADGTELEDFAFELSDGTIVKKWDNEILAQHGIMVEYRQETERDFDRTYSTTYQTVTIDNISRLPLYILWKKVSRSSGSGFNSSAGNHFITCLGVNSKGSAFEQELIIDVHRNPIEAASFWGGKKPSKPLSKYFSEISKKN